MGGHQEEPLSPILGEERPGDGGGVPAGAADGGVGEEQRHHSFGGSGDHGPADGGVSAPRHHFLFAFCFFLLWAVTVRMAMARRRSYGEKRNMFLCCFMVFVCPSTRSCDLGSWRQIQLLIIVL